MADPNFLCDSSRAHCVQSPPHPTANSPHCEPDPSGDPIRAKCNYLKHSIPFEILTNSSTQTEPVQFLATFSQDVFAITNMQTEKVVYTMSISISSKILDISLVSPSNFINTAYIVVLTSYLTVYTISYTNSIYVTSCPIYSSTDLSQIDTIYDERSNTTWIGGIASTGIAFFFQIKSGCPGLPEKWIFVSPDNSVDIIQIQSLSFVSQIEPDHDYPDIAGCFPPLSSRTLVYLSTPTLVFVFGFDPLAPFGEVNITATGPNTLYDVALIPDASSISALTVFGECWGNYNAPSQMLWLALGLTNKSSESYPFLQLISLNEFSLSPFSCDTTDSSWWLHPASFRNDKCTMVTLICQDTNYYVAANDTCQPRQVGDPKALTSAPTNIQHRMQTSPYNGADDSSDYAHLLFSWQPSDLYLTINAFQEIVCETTAPGIPFILQSIVNVGVGRPLDSVHISENGQHVMIAYSKEKWEIMSNQRLLQICTILNYSSPSPSSPSVPTPTSFLIPFNSSCTSLQPSPFTTYDYMLYFSPCSGGGNCWRYGNYKNYSSEDFENTFVSHPSPSNYSIRPTSQLACDPGFFCPGYGFRIPCLSGHICPESGMTSPSLCDLDPKLNNTCHQTGLIEPAKCPSGMVCILPNAPPVPVPPGYYVSPGDRRTFQKCAEGDWCPLQRSNVSNAIPVDLSCEAGSFCNDPSVLTPTPCTIEQVSGQNLTQYCPNGTVNPSLCAAGNYCESPQTQLPCELTYYCPEGSFQMNLCPAGFYCPEPSKKLKCTSGHYCREGFTTPEKCHPLVVCPAGTPSEKFAISGILFDIAIVVVLLVAYAIGLKIRDRMRKKRDAIRVASPLPKRMSTSINLKPKTNTINFGFDKMGLELHGSKKKVLDGVTGEIRSGRVTAVMGPSGAGKTTFLTTLAGKASYGDRTGTVFINNEPADIQQYKKVLGFVPQEDVMHRELTVKEIIRFNAEVRLPSKFSTTKKAEMTNEVISVLGLWDIRHQVIGDETTRGISGGQRKRVNIGMELVADPTVIFLDEPTSGLDSTSSEEVVACLRKVADLGLTIVTVLHQPRYEIFQMFHDVLLLGKGGRTVYIGPSEKALEYFQSIGFACPEHTNPPDFFMDVISGRVPRAGHPEFTPLQLFELWENRKVNYSQASSHSKDSGTIQRLAMGEDSEGDLTTPLVAKGGVEKDIQRQTAGFFKQLFLFTVRAMVQQTRDLRGFFWDNVLIVIAGTLLGALYIDPPYKGPVSPALAEQCPPFIANLCLLPQTDKLNAMGSLVSLSIGFTAMAASLRCFGTEKVIFWRESASGINKVAYFLGKNIAQLVNIILAPVVFLSIFYTLTSPRATFLSYFEVLLLLQFAVVGVGYVVSIVLTYKNAQLTGVVVALVWAMFGGVNPPLKQLKQNFITHVVASLSPYRWSQEALYIAEIKRFEGIYNIKSSVEYWGFSINNQTNDLIALLVIGVGARLIGLVCLMVLNRDKMK
eukprot:Phypoly_transcript_00452.p1 GENE.Phypoly_transcript_00452~~Phypoly_transcript_00452.p1  ORF type:complete len:1573 (+),score=187.05 Phypoly_transcript_00452:292-4719(+)